MQQSLPNSDQTSWEEEVNRWFGAKPPNRSTGSSEFSAFDLVGLSTLYLRDRKWIEDGFTKGNTGPVEDDPLIKTKPQLVERLGLLEKKIARFQDVVAVSGR